MADASGTQINDSIYESVMGLCRGRGAFLHDWFFGAESRAVPQSLAMIFFGLGSYGLCMGLGHSWEMAAYVAIKLPFIIFLTLGLNGLINGIFASLSGSGIDFRQSFRFLLSGFGLMGVILGSLAPIAFFNALSAPGPDEAAYRDWHQGLLLGHVTVIALAGILAHWRLLSFLKAHAANPSAALRVFSAWLVGNLIAGSQVGWIMRPVFGSPGLDAALLRDDPLDGSFFEAVFNALTSLI